MDERVLFNRNYSYENLKWHLNIFCHTVFRIMFIVYGFLQSAVIHSAMVKTFNDDNVFVFALALILGFFPFVGTFLGIFCAQIVWAWNFPHSVFVFFAPYFIAHGPLWVIICVDIYKDSLRWRESK